MARHLIEKDEVCGTCKWHRFSKTDDAFVCICLSSEYKGEETEYKDSCDAWEVRECKQSQSQQLSV